MDRVLIAQSVHLIDFLEVHNCLYQKLKCFLCFLACFFKGLGGNTLVYDRPLRVQFL